MKQHSNAQVFSSWTLAFCIILLTGSNGADELYDITSGRISPQHVAAYVGSTVKLRCKSDIPVIWRKLGQKDINRKHLKKAKSLILNQITMKDNGTYYCYGHNDGRFFKDFADIFVGVQDNKGTKGKPFNTLYINESKTVTIECIAKNGTVMWYFDSLKSHPIGYGSPISLSVTPHFHGVVHCYGYDMKKQHYFISKTILRMHKPKFVNPRISVKRINEYHEIYCKSFYNAQWKHDGKPVSNNVRVIGSKYLVINKVSMSHRGTYTCEGRTENGLYFYSTSILNIIGLTNLIHGQKLVVVSKGKNAIFHCGSYGQVTWIHNQPGPLRENMFSYVRSQDPYVHILKIYNVTKYDSGKYWCYAEYDNFIGVDMLKLKVKGRRRSNVKQLHI